MLKSPVQLTLILGSGLAFMVQPKICGQAIADSSSGTQVIQSKPNVTLVQDGTVVENFLFHSFKDFSIPEGQTVRFTPKSPRNIQTIFSRVTGTNISHLRGKLQTKGKANVVFINPNGIIFHENFKLGIKGSFLATTAESILFKNGDRFSTILAQSSPLLKLSVPNGLQFGKRPGDIKVLTGNETANFNNGLKTNDFHDIALMGGDIKVKTGKVIAPGGNIWLGSTQDSGLIHWKSGEDWDFSPHNVKKGGKIEINEISKVFSSFNQAKGGVNGAISLFGNQISIENSSLNAENRGRDQGGDIMIHATQTLDLIASDPLSKQSSPTLTTQPRAKGGGGSIILSAQNINIMSESLRNEIRRVVTDSARSRADVNPKFLGKPGNIQISADQMLSIQGGSVISAVASALESNTQSGDINIRAKRLDILGGSQVRTSTESIQPGGQLTVEVQERILLSGVLDFINNQGERIFRPSALLTDSNRKNVGGAITVITPVLRIEDGASIQSDTVLEGQSGDIRIEVEKLELSNGGQIRANANSPDAGTAGNITVQASKYVLLDGKIVFPSRPTTDEVRVSTIQANTTTQQDNTTETGNISLTTPLLLLQDDAVISANSDGSQGGDIFLNIAHLLFLAESSRIESNANSGGGGSIQVKGTPFILSPPGSNSDITANSDLSTGGQILINSLGIEGFQINPTSQNLAQLKALQNNQTNDIAASSGNPNLQGEVVINNPNSLIQKFTQLDTPLNESSTLEQCQNSQSGQSSQFHLAGQGGMVPSSLPNIEPWDDTRTPIESSLRSASVLTEFQAPTPQELFTPLIQANAWILDQQGQVILAANLPNPHLEIQHHASTSCHSLG